MENFKFGPKNFTLDFLDEGLFDYYTSKHSYHDFLTPGVGALAGGALSAGAGIFGSSTATNAQINAANQAAQIQAAQFQQNRNDLAPYRIAGGNALSALSGISGTGPGNPVDPYLLQGSVPFYYNQNQIPPALSPSSIANEPLGTSGYPVTIENALKNFRGSPDYEFQFQQGQRGANQGLAATGQLASGSALRGLTQYGQGLASTNYQNYFSNLMTGLNTAQNQYQNYFTNASNINQMDQSNYSNYFNRLASLAGIGQASTNTTAQLGAGAASNIAGNTLYGGASAAAGAIGGANAFSGGVNSGLNNYLLASYLPNQSGSSYGGSNSGAPNYNPQGVYGGYSPQTQNLLDFPATQPLNYGAGFA